MKRPFKLKAVKSGQGVRLSASSVDELAWFGAAYAMTEDAYVQLEAEKNGEAVVLLPKGKTSTAALTKGFALEYGNQAARWAVSRANLGVRAEVLRRALELSEERVLDQEAPPRLPPEHAAEIARLLAEADAETGPRDPLGIATPWSQLRGPKP